MAQGCIVAKVTSDHRLMAMKVIVAGEDNQPYTVLHSFMVLLAIMDFVALGFALCTTECVCVCVCVVHSLVVLQVPQWWSVC